MSEERNEKLEEIRRFGEAILRRQQEDFARLRAMDTSDKEAVQRAYEEALERNEEDQRQLEKMMREISDKLMANIEDWRAKSPEFSEWIDGVGAEQVRLEREKNEQEGWHEVIE